ncbi:MAG: cytidylate kinase-like family protein [Verrucomicrobia bacterium]|nr:cytidylate kinase-like family protein [Verrucomicrobiota bacterium]
MRTSFESFQHYVQSQSAVPIPEREPHPLAITISREAGAGAVTIAQMVAERLRALEKTPGAPPWTVVDANLAEQVAKDHKLPERLKNLITEEARAPVNTAVEELLGLQPSPWTLVQHTTETILRLAQLGRVILVGRGGNIITARLSHVLHVRLVAPWDDRVNHLARLSEVSHAEAARIAKSRDQARRAYLRRYFNVEIDDPTLYDLTLNTGRLGFARTADLILEAARSHQQASLGAAGQMAGVPST